VSAFSCHFYFTFCIQLKTAGMEANSETPEILQSKIEGVFFCERCVCFKDCSPTLVSQQWLEWRATCPQGVLHDSRPRAPASFFIYLGHERPSARLAEQCWKRIASSHTVPIEVGVFHMNSIFTSLKTYTRQKLNYARAYEGLWKNHRQIYIFVLLPYIIYKIELYKAI